MAWSCSHRMKRLPDTPCARFGKKKCGPGLVPRHSSCFLQESRFIVFPPWIFDKHWNLDPRLPISPAQYSPVGRTHGDDNFFWEKNREEFEGITLEQEPELQDRETLQCG